MEFMMHLIAVIPAAAEERKQLGPISLRTDKTQEMVDLSPFADDVTFDAFGYSEHHFYTEGLEAWTRPIPRLQNSLHHTKRTPVGPVGFVLSAWDPIRLAENIASADHM